MKKRVIKTKYSCECNLCGKDFTAKYSNTRYCSNACKQKAYRIGYTERKTKENTLELQLLLQKNKEMELQNEKTKMEITLQQNEIQRNTQKLQLIAEEKERERQEKERELKWKKSLDDMEKETKANNDKLLKIGQLFFNGLGR